MIALRGGELGDGDHIVAGTNVAFSFAPTTPGDPIVGLLSGDGWAVLHVRLYRYR